MKEAFNKPKSPLNLSVNSLECYLWSSAYLNVHCLGAPGPAIFGMPAGA